MSNIWFTADLHFGHVGIMYSTNRPWRNVNKMNRCLIQNWNSVVDKDDTVYILGDFTWEKQNANQLSDYIRKLNGHKILILGNHDHFKAFDYEECGFEHVHTYYFLEEQRIHLVHDPAKSIVLPNDKWLCGHVHTLFRRLNNVINVGVDVWDFKPVSLEAVLELFEDQRRQIDVNTDTPPNWSKVEEVKDNV